MATPSSPTFRERLLKRGLLFYSVLVGFLGMVATLVTVYGIIPATSASVSVEPTRPIEGLDAGEGEGEAFVVPFSIKNAGNTRVSDVRYSCAWNELAFGDNNASVRDSLIDNSRAVSINHLDPGRNLTSPCEGGLQYTLFADPIEYADISFFLSYQPRWRLDRRSEEFRFVGVREPDGRFRWLSQEPRHHGIN